jgi:acyl-CoA synthetase (AMP-forming)/AMP-acid ligase II
MIAAIDFTRPDVALHQPDRDRVLTYRELGRWVELNRELLRRLPRTGLVFQFCPNSSAAVASYLACLAERIPLGLGEPAPLPRERVIAAYQPTAIVLEAAEAPPAGYREAGRLAGDSLVLWQAERPAEVAVHPELALLLATSGSTGAAKFVRLSHTNLESNARSIAQYLGLSPGETAAQGLPLHYSYGLSVLNSHLLAGGAVALSGHSFMRPEFWRDAETCRCTSFSGVPYMYETLQRLRLDPFGSAAMRTLTQAGGALRVDLVRHFHGLARARDARFFVMYGQTEATARMAYVPPEALAAKVGAIGVAIPGGKLWLEPVPGEADLHQLHYRGPNVMLGYAAGPNDLGRGDELRGELATGDLARVDDDGFFYLTGRLARFAKLYGKRVDLGAVEGELEARFPVEAAVQDMGDRLDIYFQSSVAVDPEPMRRHLAELLAVPLPAVRLIPISRLPRTASGKKDYRALA